MNPAITRMTRSAFRIENLILVEERKVPGAEQAMLGFETLTFAPLDRRLIDVSMLSDAQRQWVDDYHAQVLNIVGPQVSGESLDWLREQTAPIA